MSDASRSVCRDDHDRRCALQPVRSGKLPGADRHDIGLRRCLDAVLLDGCAPACRVDETTPGRAAGDMALRFG